jgi:hypothetical protein
MEERPKRKTHTSNEVKSRYRRKVYKSYQFNLRKDDPLNTRLEAYEGNRTELIKTALKQYLGL